MIEKIHYGFRPVKDFYKGQLFLMLKRLCEQNSFDYCLISGKLGLLKPNDFVKPYNMQIKTKKDVLRVRELTNDKLEREIKKYDKIIVLMGKKYRDVITPLINDRFMIITDEKGIFGYLTKVSSYLKQTKKEFLNSIKKYEVKIMVEPKTKIIKFLEKNKDKDWAKKYLLTSEIAEKLNLPESTIRYHLQKLFADKKIRKIRKRQRDFYCISE